jgi:DNA-directed RNA polymerase specialized sigma24 family protein
MKHAGPLHVKSDLLRNLSPAERAALAAATCRAFPLASVSEVARLLAISEDRVHSTMMQQRKATR